jgi:Flp pilus assembly protein TadG
MTKKIGLRRLLWELCGKLRYDNRGNVFLLFAIGAPALLMASVATIDYGMVRLDKARMQAIADSASLAGARQFLVNAGPSTSERAQSFAQAQLQPVSVWNPTVNVNTDLQQRTVSVTISGQRPALLKSLFPASGWQLSVTSTAQSEGYEPLCALGSSTSALSLPSLLTATDVVNLQNSAQVTAPNCLIQSNQNVDVAPGASVNSGMTRAVGQASGNITPTPQTNSAQIPDPFATMDVSIPSLCTDLNLTISAGATTLQPGVHCGVMLFGGTAVVTLSPGTHYFVGAVVTATGSSSLKGNNVTLVFDATSTFVFSGNATISLSGTTTGPLAGFVIAAARDNILTFTISTTSARVLEGVIYIPNALLNVLGTGVVADAAAWTVIVAKAISVSGTANLTLNAGYDASPVPVPAGVGPTSVASSRIGLIQ